MLTNEERERIRLDEEYRAELRAQRAPKKSGESWIDKLAVPVIILLISGLLVPLVLGRIEDEKRRFELQSRLIEQIVGDDSAAQVSLLQYHEQLADYWANLVDIELYRRLIAVGNLDAVERQARRAELQEDLARERGVRVEVDNAYSAAMTKYLIEHRGNTEWAFLHYGRNPPLDTYVAVTRRERETLEHHIDDVYQESLATAYKKAAVALPACTDEAVCQKIADDTHAEIEALRARKPDFSRWDQAMRGVVAYVSNTKPRV